MHRPVLVHDRLPVDGVPLRRVRENAHVEIEEQVRIRVARPLMTCGRSDHPGHPLGEDMPAAERRQGLERQRGTAFLVVARRDVVDRIVVENRRHHRIAVPEAMPFGTFEQVHDVRDAVIMPVRLSVEGEQLVQPLFPFPCPVPPGGDEAVSRSRRHRFPARECP